MKNNPSVREASVHKEKIIYNYRCQFEFSVTFPCQELPSLSLVILLLFIFSVKTGVS